MKKHIYTLLFACLLSGTAIAQEPSLFGADKIAITGSYILMPTPRPYGLPAENSSTGYNSGIANIQEAIPLGASLRYDFNPYAFTDGFALGGQLEATYMMYGYRYNYDARLGENSSMLNDRAYLDYDVWTLGLELRFPMIFKFKKMDFSLSVGAFYNIYYNWTGSYYYTYYTNNNIYSGTGTLLTSPKTILTDRPEGVAAMRYGLSAMLNFDFFITKSLFFNLGIKARLAFHDGEVDKVRLSSLDEPMYFQFFGTAGIGIKINRKFNPYY